ncbi:MAG: hypothetical protein WC196_06835 [Bacilli bacterium]
MEIKDVVAWDKYVKANTDEYGKAILDYAERWANLLESSLKKGEKLEDIADKLSHKADTDGITGFMYGAAVQVLAHCWKYGEELRVWHNLKTQIGNEGEKANKTGGVLNPALLSVG